MKFNAEKATLSNILEVIEKKRNDVEFEKTLTEIKSTFFHVKLISFILFT